MYSCTNGVSNKWHIIHYGSRAVGGAGLIIVEATAIEARGRISPYDVGIWSDKQVGPLSKLTTVLKEYGSVPGVQIAHAGRKAGKDRAWLDDRSNSRDMPPGWQGIAPSPIAFSDKYPVPRQLTISDIHAVQNLFRDGARRAHSAGFEWLEIHAAHGYLIHSFYSPLSNQREDEYGGSFENRIRFLIETVQAVRPVWPERLPLTVRISGTDWVDGGWTVGESVELARRLKAEGVDLIDCSSGGGVDNAVVPVEPGYQVHISEAVRIGANIRTAAVGMITDPHQADGIIRSGQADLVLLGREFLRDPHWPLHAARSLGHPSPFPPHYTRAFKQE